MFLCTQHPQQLTGYTSIDGAPPIGQYIKVLRVIIQVPYRKVMDTTGSDQIQHQIEKLLVIFSLKS